MADPIRLTVSPDEAMRQIRDGRDPLSFGVIRDYDGSPVVIDIVEHMRMATLMREVREDEGRRAIIRYIEDRMVGDIANAGEAVE